jgi:hypothetical protein
VTNWPVAIFYFWKVALKNQLNALPEAVGSYCPFKWQRRLLTLLLHSNLSRRTARNIHVRRSTESIKKIEMLPKEEVNTLIGTKHINARLQAFFFCAIKQPHRSTDRD